MIKVFIELRCPSCDHETFSDQRWLRIHMEKRHNILITDYPRGRKPLKPNHELVKTKDSDAITHFGCPGCHEYFESNESLANHITTFHTKNNG
jgi:uncharacterized C2H2 Zn-finger protein